MGRSLQGRGRGRVLPLLVALTRWRDGTMCGGGQRGTVLGRPTTATISASALAFSTMGGLVGRSDGLVGRRGLLLSPVMGLRSGDQAALAGVGLLGC